MGVGGIWVDVRDRGADGYVSMGSEWRWMEGYVGKGIEGSAVLRLLEALGHISTWGPSPLLSRPVPVSLVQ